MPIYQALEGIGHPQGLILLQFDNKCATGIINDKIRQKSSKCMDMPFYWLRDRSRQWQIYVCWKYGSENDADYPSKHHPTQHHITIQPRLVLHWLKIRGISWAADVMSADPDLFILPLYSKLIYFILLLISFVYFPGQTYIYFSNNMYVYIHMDDILIIEIISNYI